MSIRVLLIWALALVVSPAGAQDIEDARAAYHAGDYDQALVIARGLSNTGDAGAQNLLGVLYENGRGVARDPGRAILYYEAAIAQGDDLAMTNLGILYSEGAPGLERRPDLARPLLERAIALGNVGAINALGVLYELGIDEGGPDYARAIENYREAMALGDLDAAANLGGLYAEGLGVAQDYARARAYAGIAADGGLARAMEMLAWMVEYGYGGAPDVPQALIWYERAADAGNVASLYALGDILYNGAEGVAVDIPRALAFYERGHAAGDADSSYALGWIYEGGRGVAADPERALGYYQAAFAGGLPEAVYVMGLLYQEGEVLPVDLVYSRELLDRAADLGEVLAYSDLGTMLVEGLGGPADWPRAEMLFREGYRGGDAEAAINLARLLNDPGYGRNDPVEALSYCLWGMRQASADGSDSYGATCEAIAGGLSPEDRARAGEWAEAL